MRFDLNLFSLEANSLVPPAHSGVSKRKFSVSPLLDTQALGQIIAVADQEAQRKRTISLSNEPSVLIMHSGSYQTATRIRSLPFEQDILISVLPISVPLASPPYVFTSPQVSSAPHDPWDVIERLIGTIDGPPDWSSQHDHYLYGIPKD